jgi:hypothetical protein
MVIAGHRRPKDGVALLAYDPAIHRFSHFSFLMDARVKPAHDEQEMLVGKRQSSWIP